MTESAVVYTAVPDGSEAGEELGAQIRSALRGARPDVVIVFASSSYVYKDLLAALDAGCRPVVLVGCSSAGEFVTNHQGKGAACAIALRSDEMKFSAALGPGLREAREEAARRMVDAMVGLNDHTYRYHSALILTDALAGHADGMVDHLNLLTAGTYQFFGGGAGDDGKFSRTHVFLGTDAYSDAAVILEILSNKPLGIGVSHGWTPVGKPLRVTDIDGARLVSLNAIPANEVFRDFAAETGQEFDQTDPLPFFLQNVLGIDTGDGFKIRAPLMLHEDGSITCAAEIPLGATVHIMCASPLSTAEAAARATRSALDQLHGNKPEVALFFDCVATRLRTQKDFSLEMQAIREALGGRQYAGCNTYGQIARANGQFNGFHNCTATICVIPE